MSRFWWDPRSWFKSRLSEVEHETKAPEYQRLEDKPKRRWFKKVDRNAETQRLPQMWYVFEARCPECGLDTYATTVKPESEEEVLFFETCPECGTVIGKERCKELGRMLALTGQEAIDRVHADQIGRLRNRVRFFEGRIANILVVAAKDMVRHRWGSKAGPVDVLGWVEFVENFTRQVWLDIDEELDRMCASAEEVRITSIRFGDLFHTDD